MRVPKAGSIFADDLRRRILTDRLMVGAELPSESELISQYGLSRGTIREGLRLLEAEGLISIRRGARGGISVSRPGTSHVSRAFSLLLALSDTTIRDLCAFRLLIEPAATALATIAATEEQRVVLLETARPFTTEAVRHNVDFHVVVADATNNEWFRVTLRALHEVILWHSLDEGLAQDLLETAGRAHARIAAHMYAREPEKAERAMRRHIEAFVDVLERRGRLDSPIIRRSEWNTVLGSAALPSVSHSDG